MEEGDRFAVALFGVRVKIACAVSSCLVLSELKPHLGTESDFCSSYSQEEMQNPWDAQRGSS